MNTNSYYREINTDRILSCVAGTSHRIKIITALDGKEMDLRDLSDDLGIPRSTLRYNLEKLKEVEIVEENLNRNYLLTPLGQATLSGVKEFQIRVEAEARLEPLYSCIPASTFDFHFGAFEDATITVAQPARPYLPSSEMLNDVRDATHISTALPSASPLVHQNTSKLVDRDNLSLEVILSEEAITAVQNDPSIEINPLVDHDAFTFRTISDTLPYGLALSDGKALIQGFDDQRKPHVLVETEDPRCRSWVESQLEMYRASASLMTL